MFNTKDSNTMENQTLKEGQQVIITKGEHKGLKAIIFSTIAFDGGVKLKVNGEQIYNGSFSSFPVEWLKAKDFVQVEPAEVTEGLDAYELDTIKTLIFLKIEAAKEATDRSQAKMMEYSKEKKERSFEFWQQMHAQSKERVEIIEEIYSLFEFGKNS